ncbi:hypothetical protein C2W64_00184 [Brevibacillus laterosporus]|nr:hypothetical protein C2W64_00184 [Brevibacillus laterosporus]
MAIAGERAFFAEKMYDKPYCNSMQMLFKRHGERKLPLL